VKKMLPDPSIVTFTVLPPRFKALQGVRTLENTGIVCNGNQESTSCAGDFKGSELLGFKGSEHLKTQELSVTAIRGWAISLVVNPSG
jgi:hypothetical protein